MLLLILLLVISLMFGIAGVSGAPWVPARAFDVEPLLDDAKLKKGELFLELGCGDGRLLKAAAQRGSKAIGYELNPVLWLFAYLRNVRNKNVSVRLGNLWHADLSSADVVMIFLLPRTLTRLVEKAEKEMKSGSRLVSYIFPLPGKKQQSRGKSWLVYKF